MSYEIVYDHQFIKAKKDNKEVFFPMLYWGSNNCYQYDRSNRGRRARGWSIYTYITGCNHYNTKEAILSIVDKMREDTIERNRLSNEKYIADGRPDWVTEYNDKSYGSHIGLSIGGASRSCTFKQFRNLFEGGCDKALTVEELLKFHISTEVSTYIFDDNKKQKYLEAGKKEYNEQVKTSDELIAKLEEVYDHIGDFDGVSVYVTIDATENQMKWLRRELYPKAKKEKTYIDVDKHFVVKDNRNGNYVLKATRGGYKYSANGKCHCKRFLKESEAKRYAKNLGEKYFGNIFEVEEVNGYARILVYV